MDGNTVLVEGARPDERIISDNVLEDTQKAYPVTTPKAASLHSMPPVCEDTIEQQDADAMAARLVYQDAEVMVEVVAQADFKPDMVNLTGSKSLSVRQTTACCFFHGDCTGLQEGIAQQQSSQCGSTVSNIYA